MTISLNTATRLEIVVPISFTELKTNLVFLLLVFLLYLVIFPNKSMNLSLMELPLSQSRITVYFKKTEDKHISALLFAPQ